MLKVMDEDYLATVRAFAVKTNQLDELEKQLKYLDTYADPDSKGLTLCKLGKDFAPLSFAFTMLKKQKGEYEHWFSGGCIYHGDHDNGGDGSAPTFSVNLNPVQGWSIHT